MKVSIIIPVYNKERYILSAIVSARQQMYSDVEVIVVDDGSTDCSAATAQKYGAKVIQQKNMGQEHRSAGPARNTGIAYATGELILPLDADDWIERDYLAKTVPLMTEGVAIVSTDMRRTGMMAETIPARVRTLAEQLVSNEIPVTSLLRKDAVLAVHGYWKYGWEDWELWIKLLEAGWGMAVVNEPLFHYWVRPGGLNDDQTRMRAELSVKMRERHPAFTGHR